MNVKEKNDFIQSIAGYVEKYAPQYGIAVNSPIIAQAILESNWGKSKLASYHNYFGLKCGSKWTGKSVNMKTMEEYTAGIKIQIRDNFRAYGSMDEGVKGYFEFINVKRYSNLKGITDPLKYLETIKKDGYATSSTYVQNVYSVVKSNGLIMYDGLNSDDMAVETEQDVRKSFVDIASGFLGLNEADGSYKVILDIYNNNKPLPRGYKVKVKDAWCATFTSAVAIKAGLSDIIPIECSCVKIIEKAKNMGIWVENDGYIPNIGDLVLYDWQDSGKGDNKGTPDHIGMVQSINGNSFTVIEGNKNNRVETRELEVNGKYIRGFVTPDFSNKATKEDKALIVGDRSLEEGLKFKVGDIVDFAGTVHYKNSSAWAVGYGCMGGKATVTAVKADAAHPYHLKAVTGKGSTVWGWVNETDVKDFVSQKSIYTVKAGDTLNGISRTYNTTVEELSRLNGIEDVNRIFVGQVIQLK